MLKGLKILPTNSKINFIGLRFVTYVISALLSFGSLGLFLTKGVNYGIDFKGGTMIEVRTPAPVDLAKMRTRLGALNLGDVSLQEFGSPQDILIRVEQQKGSEKDQLRAIETIKEALGADMEYRRIETVGPTVGAELVENSIYAVLWALIAMLVYIWLRFEWQFGVCAILALAHDALAILGLYSLFGLEFNLTAIVAILITIGYSINDTVVIYDRVRENLRKFKKKALEDVLNLSINETLARTILTSTSTLLALLALYYWGGEVISTYSLPILVGVAVGTYSSIFLAAPLLKSFNFKVRREDDKKAEFQNDVSA